MTDKTVRPSSVTTATWLIALAAVIDIVSGWALLILAGDVVATTAAGVEPKQVQIAAWLLIGVGVLTAVIASLISKGSNMTRLFVTVLMVLQVGGHIWSLVVGGNASFASAAIGIVIAIGVVVLLWTAESNAYFAAKEAAAKE